MVWQRQTDKKKTDNPKWVSSVYTVVDTMRDCIINKFNLTPTVDAFATKHNRRFKRFWNKETDAFTRDWSSEQLLWVNGPFEHYNRIVDKIISDGAKAIVICPMWQRMKWWKRIQSIKIDSYLLPLGVKIFQDSHGKPLRPRPWRTMALLVDGKKVDQIVNDDSKDIDTKKVDNNIDDSESMTDDKNDTTTMTKQQQTDSCEYHVHYHIYYHPIT